MQRREGNVHARVAIPAQHPARIANLHRAEDGSDSARRVILDRPERVAIRADPTEEGIGLRLMSHDSALQRCHDLLAVSDGQSDVAVEQALPALCDPHFPPANVAEFVLPPDRDRPFHRHRFLSEQSDTDGLHRPNNPCSTPEKLPVSSYHTKVEVFGRPQGEIGYAWHYHVCPEWWTRSCPSNSLCAPTERKDAGRRFGVGAQRPSIRRL